MSFYPTGSPSTLFLDEMMLFFNGTTPWGFVEGVKVTIDEDWQNLGPSLPGGRANVKGLDRKIRESLVIEGTLKELDATKIDQVMPGATTVTATGTTTVTPPNLSTFLQSSDYPTAVRAIGKLGANYLEAIIPVAFVRAMSIEGAKADMGGIPIRIESRQDTGGTTDAPTYSLKIEPTIT